MVEIYLNWSLFISSELRSRTFSQKMSAPLALPLMAFINSSVISITASELIRPEPAMVPKKNGSYIAM